MGGIESSAGSIFLFFLEKQLAVHVAHMVEILVSIVLPDIGRNVRQSSIFGESISRVNFCTASTGLIQSQIEHHHCITKEERSCLQISEANLQFLAIIKTEHVMIGNIQRKMFLYLKRTHLFCPIGPLNKMKNLFGYSGLQGRRERIGH